MDSLSLAHWSKSRRAEHLALARWSKSRRTEQFASAFCPLLRWGTKLRPRFAHFCAGERKCVRVLLAFALGSEKLPAFYLLLRWGTKMRLRFAHFCVGERKCARTLPAFTLGNKNAPARCLLLRWGRKTRLRVGQTRVRRDKSRLRVISRDSMTARRLSLSKPLHCIIAASCGALSHTPATYRRITLRHIGAY